MLTKIIIETWLQDRKTKIQDRAKSKDQGSFPLDVDVNGEDVIKGTLGTSFNWIYNAWEYGRGKRVSSVKTDFEEKLAKWISRKGLTIKASSF